MVSPFNTIRCGVGAVVFLAIFAVDSLSAQTAVKFSPSRSAATGALMSRAVSAQILGTPHEEIVGQNAANIVIVDAQPGLAPATTTIPLGNYISSFAVGDIDLDGDQDIVCGMVPNYEIKVLRNQGNGGFAISSFAAAWGLPVHLADFTGDGYLDILCGGERLINNGAGAFPTTISFTFGTSAIPIDVMPGDFDGDGDQDILSIYPGTISSGSGIIARLFRRTASGSFTQLTAMHLDDATQAIPLIADVNADGKDDLILSTPAPTADSSDLFRRKYRTFLGQVGPTIAAQPGRLIDRDFGIPPIVADWNSDGFLDLFVGGFGYTGTFSYANESRFGVLLGDGTGQFAPAAGPGFYDQSSMSSAGNISTFAATDDDLDGNPDLVVVTSSQFVYFRNDSAAATPTATTVTYPTGGIIVARTDPLLTGADFILSLSGTNPAAPAASHWVAIDFLTPSGAPYRVTQMTSSTGYVRFFLPVGYATPSIPVTISTPEGMSANFTVVTQATIAVVGGTGQSVLPSAPFLPLTGMLLGPGSVPIQGVNVYCGSVNGYDPMTFTPDMTDANGQFAINGNGWNFAGVLSLQCYVNSYVASPTFNLTVVYAVYGVTMTAGTGQTVCAPSPIIPIVGTMTNQFGGPIVGQTLLIAPTGPSGPEPITFNSNLVSTGQNGVFTFTGTANPVASTRTYTVSSPGSAPLASFTISSLGPVSISIVAGQGQSIDIGEVLPSPIVVELTDCSGLPIVGATVNLTPQTSGASVSTPTLTTDSSGRISFLPSLSAIGAQRIRVSLGTQFFDAIVIVRGLAVTNIGLLLAISFQAEHANIPLLLAVDSPPSTPYLSTPYGDIWTTILAPQPTLFVLDGFGIFGSVDPGMTTSPQGSWLRTYPLQPEFYNVTFIVQMYGYDNLNVFPNDYVVSNPAFFTL